MSYIKYYLFVGLLALQFASCDDTYKSSIPDYPVHLELNLAAEYSTFRNSTNKSFTFIRGITPGIPETNYTGFGGILVYSGFDGQYYAFDMSCPYEAKQNIRVHPNDIGQAICDSCKTVFNIGYGIGDPASGPAKETLRRYKTNLSGDILYITR
jgi:nitrite reductase/ring-hydroxylating ferredoxin subunit